MNVSKGTQGGSVNGPVRRTPAPSSVVIARLDSSCVVPASHEDFDHKRFRVDTAPQELEDHKERTSSKITTLRNGEFQSQGY